MARENYTSIRIRTDANEAIKRLVRRLAAETDTDVTQSEAIGIAAALTLDHLGDAAAILADARATPSGEGND